MLKKLLIMGTIFISCNQFVFYARASDGFVSPENEGKKFLGGSGRSLIYPEKKGPSPQKKDASGTRTPTSSNRLRRLQSTPICSHKAQSGLFSVEQSDEEEEFSYGFTPISRKEEEVFQLNALGSDEEGEDFECQLEPNTRKKTVGFIQLREEDLVGYLEGSTLNVGRTLSAGPLTTPRRNGDNESPPLGAFLELKINGEFSQKDKFKNSEEEKKSSDNIFEKNNYLVGVGLLLSAGLIGGFLMKKKNIVRELKEFTYSFNERDIVHQGSATLLLMKVKKYLREEFNNMSLMKKQLAVSLLEYIGALIEMQRITKKHLESVLQNLEAIENKSYYDRAKNSIDSEFNKKKQFDENKSLNLEDLEALLVC